MSRTPIPERQPIGDEFTGFLVRLNNMAQALALTRPDGIEVIYGGAITLRYGVRYLGKPHFSIVPGLVAIDYGEMLTGEAAWDFLTRRSNLYPRAEVFGYRNDGRDEMTTVKNLDFVLPIEVLAFPSSSDTVPVGFPEALIADEAQTSMLPPRLIETLPRFVSVEAWLSERTSS